MKKIITLLLLLFSVSLFGQTETLDKNKDRKDYKRKYDHVFLNLSFYPPSPWDFSHTNRIHHLSLNAVGAQSAKIHGVEVSGVMSLGLEEVIGAQISGIVNIADGPVRGMQLAGITNVISGSLQGVQISGIANIAIGAALGGQISGVANIAEGKALAQVSALANVAGHSTILQLGLVNVAMKASGVQLGLINIAEEHSGLPIGIINIVGGMSARFDVWQSEYGTQNVAYKSGTKYLYSMMALRAGDLSRVKDWELGYAVGVHVQLGKYFFIDTDVGRYAQVDKGNGFFEFHFDGGPTLLKSQLGFRFGPTMARIANSPVM